MQLHCNCGTEEMITAVEVFILTSVWILVHSLITYTCIALRHFILKRKKQYSGRVCLEADRIKDEDQRKTKTKTDGTV